MTDLPRISIIYTGGTFGMSSLPGPLHPDSYSFELLEWIPELAEIATIDLVSLFNIDSSQMNPGRWQEIARTIARLYPERDGFVIIHGTDTMAYTAAALTFMLEGLSKPLILTGSQLPLSALRTDARSNLINSVLLATKPIPEVGVFFNVRLYRGSRIQKRDVWSYDAFESPNLEPLAVLGIDIKLSPRILKPRTDFHLDERIDSNIAVIRIIPGFNPAVLSSLADQSLHGLVIEAFGAGNLPVSHPVFLELLHEFSRRDIPVVIASQSERGAVNLGLYEPGEIAATAGAISSGDMSVECSAVKLMIALGRWRSLPAIREYLLRDQAGERSDS
jgi:L-asparaginase